jgi:hypothetical protein
MAAGIKEIVGSRVGIIPGMAGALMGWCLPTSGKTCRPAAQALIGIRVGTPFALNRRAVWFGAFKLEPNQIVLNGENRQCDGLLDVDLVAGGQVGEHVRSSLLLG